MTQQEYEQKKRECWENIKFALRAPNTDRKTFDFIFDRAYALGKQTEAIMCEDVEKAAEEYAEKAMEHVYSGEWDSEYVQGLIEAAWYDGYTALGKQENDANTVISGWVARDKDGHLFMYCTKPERNENLQVWMGRYADFCLRDILFPDLTWDDEPIEVGIIIKRKKK